MDVVKADANKHNVHKPAYCKGPINVVVNIIVNIMLIKLYY